MHSTFARQTQRIIQLTLTALLYLLIAPLLPVFGLMCFFAWMEPASAENKGCETSYDEKKLASLTRANTMARPFVNAVPRHQYPFC